MLLAGINHVAVLTADTDRLHAFYRDVFDATVFADDTDGDVRLSFVDVGPSTRLNVFEIAGNTEAQHQTPMFGRGRIDHFGLEAASQDAFDTIRERLIACGASDGFVSDFGIGLGVFFRDPDGLEGEVNLHFADATPADIKPPGVPAASYEPVAATPAGGGSSGTSSRCDHHSERGLGGGLLGRGRGDLPGGVTALLIG